MLVHGFIDRARAEQLLRHSPPGEGREKERSGAESRGEERRGKERRARGGEKGERRGEEWDSI